MLTLVLTVPTIIQFHHSFVEHTNILVHKTGINTANNDLNCSVFHHIFKINSTLNLDKFNYFTNQFWTIKIINFNHLNSNKQLLTLLTRGPPSLLT